MPGAIGEVWRSLSEVPLGADQDEAFLRRPYNASRETALYFAKNHSRTMERRVLVEAVSHRQGGYGIIGKGKYKNTGESVQALRERAAAGEDVNLYEDVVKAVAAEFTWNGQKYIIPPAASADEEPEEILVPEGLVFLYSGDPSRLNSSDPKERVAELSALQQRRGYRFVIRPDNPFGYIEFIRRELRQPDAAELDKIYPGDIEES